MAKVTDWEAEVTEENKKKKRFARILTFENNNLNVI